MLLWFAFGCVFGYMVGRFTASIELINMSMACWTIQGELECLEEERNEERKGSG